MLTNKMLGINDIDTMKQILKKKIQKEYKAKTQTFSVLRLNKE